MTLEEFQEGLRNADPDVRAYLVGKLMRQAKPDDVFEFGNDWLSAPESGNAKARAKRIAL